MKLDNDCDVIFMFNMYKDMFSWNKCFIIHQTNAEKMMQHAAILHR